MRNTSSALTRLTLTSDVAYSVRRLLKRSLFPVALLLLGELAILIFSNDSGALAFGLVAAGTYMVFSVWARDGIGLPIIPMLALQNLLAYGVPIAAHNATVIRYPATEITRAGWEVFLNSLAMIGAWRMGMLVIRTSSPMCYALEGLDERSPKLVRYGVAMVLASSAYELLRSANLMDIVMGLLPAGSDSIVHVLVSAASACGFFLTGMMIGKGAIQGYQRAMFWVLIAVQCYIEASAFLLSTTITIVFSAAIGLFWGSGKIPWRFIAVVTVVLSFLNLGKFEMRDKYWLKDAGNPTPQFTLGQMPGYYEEWVGASWGLLVGSEKEQRNASAFAELAESTDPTKPTGQSLLERINNLQNLLFVIDTMQLNHIAPLGGATYTLIPPLLVPRVLWPEKPRTHEGQVLLNVYFGRQDLNATFETYVAWGLLAEAYGNFGPIAGALVLGAFLGFIFAWVEKMVARKLVLSMEGFLAFTLFLGMANSFEMVASVLVTSLFQAFVPIVLACSPFVHRMAPKHDEVSAHA